MALVLARVNEQPMSLIRRSGFAEELGAGCIVQAWPPDQPGEPQRDLSG